MKKINIMHTKKLVKALFNKEIAIGFTTETILVIIIFLIRITITILIISCLIIYQ